MPYLERSPKKYHTGSRELMLTPLVINAPNQNIQVKSNQGFWKKRTIYSFVACLAVASIAIAGVILKMLSNFERMAETSRGNPGSLAGIAPYLLTVAACASLVLIPCTLFFFFSLFRYLTSAQSLPNQSESEQVGDGDAEEAI
ncbi:MAG: hypothetical protein EOP86_03865 [Verrucomicrobiaceae bacterium]|nr:MAG: hypothetical protein EOP86_03865 [Verrucomicrobiaceae bacterium]